MVILSKIRPGDQPTVGALSRYLKYALGEIFLVVLGILIALQINDWYQEHLDRQTEFEYLTSMKRDLTEDTRELHAAIDGNASILEGLTAMLELLDEPTDDEAWRRDLYMHGLKYTYWFVVMEFSQLTMAQLQYSGGMRLISDMQVREAMIAYEQSLETTQQQHRDIMTYFHALEESQKHLFNLALSKQAMEYFEEDYRHLLEPMDVFEPLVPEGRYFDNDDPDSLADYYDDVLYHRTALSILNQMYQRQLQLAESLTSLIETRYGI